MAKMVMKVLITLVILAILAIVVSTSKYSKDINMKEKRRKEEKLNKHPGSFEEKDKKWKKKSAFEKEENHFRVYKVNMVWEKAKKVFRELKMSDNFDTFAIKMTTEYFYIFMCVIMFFLGG